MYLRFFANHFGYRVGTMSGRQEPRSKHMHDLALEKHKKTRQDLHPRFSQQELGNSRRPSRATRALHSTERVVMVIAAPLLVMKLRITELGTGRGRALTEI